MDDETRFAYLLALSSEEEMKEWLKNEVEDSAKRLSEDMEMKYEEVYLRLVIYRALFQSRSLELCIVLSESLCDWILSKKIRNSHNPWHRYSVFKCFVGTIDSDIYDQIITIASRRLVLE